jgi:hypothetical protein
MRSPEIDITRSAIAVEIFSQWQRARGRRLEPASRALSRSWEDLLEAAGLRSAVERQDAESDARALKASNLLVVKSPRYRPHLIGRVSIPLEAEERWMEAFGFVAPNDTEARQIKEFPWVPRLAFVADARVNISFSDLRLLNEFMLRAPPDAELVPVKERSLQIFGDEKRLDAIANSVLFREDRLSLERDCKCVKIGVPLAWKRGPQQSSHEPVIVLENAATWHSYCRWNERGGFFSAVIYGEGNRFLDGVGSLDNIFEELGGERRVFYFGDIDPQGLAIPQDASRVSRELGLPVVEPHMWSYRHLLCIGLAHAQECEADFPSRPLWSWLEDCAEQVHQLFLSRRRIAQEHVGWEFLRASCPSASSSQ